MTTTRIYRVNDGKTDRLIRATHPGPALAHVAKSAFTVRVATQDDLEALFAAGVKVETVGAEVAKD